MSTPPPLNLGSTLLIPDTGPAHDSSKPHLFVVVTNECENGKRLLVPICSEREACDTTCLVNVGEHSFINRPSYVAYNKARTFDAKALEEKLRKGEVVYKGEFLPSRLPYLCEGIVASPYISLKLKNYYSECKKFHESKNS